MGLLTGTILAAGEPPGKESTMPPWRAQGHLLTVLPGMPVTLKITMTFTMIVVIIIMIIVNVFIPLTKTHTLF